MHALKFDEDVCATCPSADCLLKCQYMALSKGKALSSCLIPALSGLSSGEIFKDVAPAKILILA